MIWSGPWYAQILKTVLAMVLIGGFLYVGPWDMGRKIPKWVKKLLGR